MALKLDPNFKPGIGGVSTSNGLVVPISAIESTLVTALAVAQVDGNGNQVTPRALKMTVSGTITYIAKAAAGSLQSASVWQCLKLDQTTGMLITWADGDTLFNNIATDLTALSYS